MILNIYTDASFNPKVDIGKCAIVIKNESGRTITQFVEHVSCKSPNEAEFLAVCEAIDYIFTEYINSNFIHNINLFTDSQGIKELITHKAYIQKVQDTRSNKMNGIDNQKKIELFCKINLIRKSLPLSLNWIPRELNKDADKLSKMYTHSSMLKK